VKQGERPVSIGRFVTLLRYDTNAVTLANIESHLLLKNFFGKIPALRF